MRQGEERRMLDELIDIQEKLSEWESSFLESIADQLDRFGRLTQKQKDKLIAIYEQRVLGY